MSRASRDELRERVDKALAVYLADRRAWLAGVDQVLAPVGAAIETFVLRGGKRLRPAFAYWGYRGAGGATPTPWSRPCLLEFVQASALMHDDLIDRSDTRRGEPAIHRRFAAYHRAQGYVGDPDGFGDAAAVLLGDLCLVWSDGLLQASGLDPAALARARPVFDEMRQEVTVGQYLDMQCQAAGAMSVPYEGLCPQIRAQVNREAFENAMRNHRQVRAHRIVDASVHTVDGRATGLVTVEVTYDDGAVERRTLTLTGDDGDWAVCGLPYQ